MVELLYTLLPLSLFWILEAIYLGGWPVDAKGGGGFRQVLGLIFSFVLWLVVWRGLHSFLLGVGPTLGGIVLPTLGAAVLLPFISWVGFKIVGVSIVRSHASAH